MTNGRRRRMRKALAALPVLTIEKIGEAPPKPWPDRAIARCPACACSICRG